MDENVSYHRDLEKLASSLGLSHATFKKLESASAVQDEISVVFLLSVSDKLKQDLLDSASLLLYTPQNEHFGIVPLEAMLDGVPVLAATSGGPLETVVDGETGWLRDVSDSTAWTGIMSNVLRLAKSDPSKLAAMGEAGQRRVFDYFSKRMMALRLEKCLDDMKTVERQPIVNVLIFTTLLLVTVAIIVGVTLTRVLFFALEKDAAMEARRLGQRAARTAATTTSRLKNEL